MQTTSKRKLIVGCFALIATLIPTLSIARRGRVRFHGAGLRNGVSSSVPTLTRDELRTCVNSQERINSLAEYLDRSEEITSKDARKIDELATEIEKRRLLVDHFNQDSVDKFNSLVSQHRRSVEIFNAKLPEFNGQVKIYNQQIEFFNSKCASRAYYENDMTAINSNSSQNK